MADKKAEEKTEGKKYDGGAIRKLSQKEAEEARREAEEKESSSTS